MKKFFTAAYIFVLVPAAIFLPIRAFAVGARGADASYPAADALSLLASYIEGSGARDLSSMTAVGAVILNRCSDSMFPDSVSANGASLGILPSPDPSPIARYAARLARMGVDPTSGALSFFTGQSAGERERKDEYVTFSVSGFSFVK